MKTTHMHISSQQRGEITATYNDGAYYQFKSSTGAKYTVAAHELTAITQQPIAKPAAMPTTAHILNELRSRFGHNGLKAALSHSICKNPGQLRMHAAYDLWAALDAGLTDRFSSHAN